MKVKKQQSTLSLKPTQFAVGMLEIEYKVLDMKKLGKKKLQKLIDENPIPVVISPWKELCITDHHHFLFACWHADIFRVKVKVIKDYSHSRLSYHRFWQKLARENRAYLYDQFGNGPQKPLYLPMDIRGLADDPYRSLAWMIRKEGGFQNSTESFAEFRWADFFRKKGLLDLHGRKGFHRAVKRGLILARSKEAQSLPGFIANTKKSHIKKAKALVKSKYVPKAQKTGPLATKPDVSI
jgi:hypothetical protein